MVSSERLKEVKKIVKPDIMISAEKEINIEKLKELIYKKLDFMSVYCKEVRKKADLDVPLILKNKATVSDACIKLHRDFIKNFKCVKVWGKSAKFPGQRLSLRHVLKDGDIFEIHLR